MIVYAALYNPCYYESDDGVISLHANKQGAWYVQWRARWMEYERNREAYLRYGFERGKEYIHNWQWWGVKAYTLQ